jgi:hypothetical protein
MKALEQIFEEFPDLRAGNNIQYEMADAGKASSSRNARPFWNIKRSCCGSKGVAMLKLCLG